MVFERDGETGYRFRRSPPAGSGRPCVRERLEEPGRPVAETRPVDGRLCLVFYLIDAGERRAAGHEVDLRYRPDRGRLTDRQREVLRTTHAMG